MEKELTIQEVAERTGLTTYALRYYERAGLLDPVGRASSGHRRYTTEDLGLIDLLMRLRATGMSIRQMQEFIEFRRQGPQGAAAQLALLENHQRAVKQHIRDLEGHLEVIAHKIEHKKKLLGEHDRQAEGELVSATDV